MRAANKPLILTVGEPLTIWSGGPTHTAMSVTRAAGSPPMITLGEHGPLMGPPTWGTSPVTMGQVCMSVNRDAGGIVISPFRVSSPGINKFTFRPNADLHGVQFLLLRHPAQKLPGNFRQQSIGEDVVD